MTTLGESLRKVQEELNSREPHASAFDATECCGAQIVCEKSDASSCCS